PPYIHIAYNLPLPFQKRQRRLADRIAANVLTYDITNSRRFGRRGKVSSHWADPFVSGIK
ncbi:MAG: hypothetical protein KAT56_04840, partial [Sedimentisphaerales bacterium]|nr:hypothetical protein [Sedimentisphaerales bacterium]